MRMNETMEQAVDLLKKQGQSYALVCWAGRPNQKQFDVEWYSNTTSQNYKDMATALRDLADQIERKGDDNI